MHTRNYKLFTKALSNFASVHREDKVQYKGSWGRLYILEDCHWNTIVRKLTGAVDATIEVVDYITEKIKEICLLLPNLIMGSPLGAATGVRIEEGLKHEKKPMFLLIFIAQDEEAPMKIGEPMPLVVAEFLFTFIEQHGKMPSPEEFDEIQTTINKM